ncbi:MAG: hypothetical protein QM817_12355 [Archangium sp.]
MIPEDWFIDTWTLESTSSSEFLFDASAKGPQGPVVGTACQLTSPATFHLARIELAAKGLKWSVSTGGETAYLPLVLKTPPLLEVWRDETHDKDVVGEIVLGVISAGLSLLRLTPTHVATLRPPLRGKTKLGSFSAECRAVGRDSLDAALESRKKATACASLSCLRDDAAFFGPEDPGVIAKAQAIVDASAREAAEWRSQATWKHRSFEIVAVKRCGSTCAAVTFKNTSTTPRDIPSFDDALDAQGRETRVLWDFAGVVKPGATRTVRATVALNPTLTQAATFPIAMRMNDDEWSHRVPAVFIEDLVEYDIKPTGKCERGYATATVTARKLGDPKSEPDAALLSNGEGGHFSMPFGAWGQPFVQGEAQVYVGDDVKTCPVITEVFGHVPGWRYVVLP